MYTYGWIHVAVQWKITPHCKATILHYKLIKKKDEISPFLGHQCYYFLDSKTPFQGAKVILTHCVHAVSLKKKKRKKFLKECIPELFDVLCSNKL